MKYKADGCETIEIQISALKNKYFFRKSLNLRNKNILYVDFPGTELSPTGRDVINSSAQADAFLVLKNSEQEEFINRLPFKLISRNTIDNYFPLLNRKIDIERCYVEFSDTGDLTIGESIVVTFYYGNVEKLSTVNEASYIENIDVPIKTTAEQKFYFNELEKLRNKRVFLIQMLQIASVSGDTAITNTVRDMAYMTLFNRRGQIIVNRISIKGLQYAWLPFFFDDLNIDWARSFIEVPSTTGLVANSAFVFVLHCNERKRRNRD